MNGYAAPLRLARVHKIGASRQQLNLQQEAVTDWHALGKGLRWAFAIESGTALLIYAIWRLWRLMM